MSAEKMRLLSDRIFTAISKMEDYEAEKAGREKDLKLTQELLQQAYTKKDSTIEKAQSFLQKVEQYYAEEKITEAKRNEYVQTRENDLIPFDQRIHQYKEAIAKFEAKIHLLDEMIQEAGEEIQKIMIENNAESAQLKSETAKYIFSYTRFNLALFKSPPIANHPSSPDKIKHELEQQTRAYFTPHNS